MSRPLFKPGDLLGILQLAGRYLLLLACLAGVGFYVVGLVTAPALPAHGDLPSWFQPYFLGLAALTGAAAIVLFAQVDFSKLGLSPWTVILAYLFMAVGLVAAIAGATTLPSRGWYSQLLGLTNLGAATAFGVALLVGIKAAIASARTTGKTWRDALRGSN